MEEKLLEEAMMRAAIVIRLKSEAMMRQAGTKVQKAIAMICGEEAKNQYEEALLEIEAYLKVIEAKGLGEKELSEVKTYLKEATAALKEIWGADVEWQYGGALLEVERYLSKAIENIQKAKTKAKDEITDLEVEKYLNKAVEDIREARTAIRIAEAIIHKARAVVRIAEVIILGEDKVIEKSKELDEEALLEVREALRGAKVMKRIISAKMRDEEAVIREARDIMEEIRKEREALSLVITSNRKTLKRLSSSKTSAKKEVLQEAEKLTQKAEIMATRMSIYHQAFSLILQSFSGH